MIYFDNSATTRVCQKAAEKAAFIMEECYGNPSSLHSLGFKAELELELARERISQAMSCKKEELYFTSGGTEGNNIAVLGGARSKKRWGKRIVCSAVEHPSVLVAMEQLEHEGFQIEYLFPQKDGNISPAQVEDAITEDTVLVSLMSVNNETGALMPLEAVAPAIAKKRSRAMFHVDNVQGFGKLKLNLKALGVDLMTVSGHKIHAPKGTGALFVAKNARIHPIGFGGNQERKMRPGTENLPGIAAFGQAVLEPEHMDHIKGLWYRLYSGISEIPTAAINSPKNSLPYILNFTPGRVRGETLMHYLGEREIFVSTGSACTGANPSHVLTAMGLSRDRVESSVRVSFCRDNTVEQVEEFLLVLKQGLAALARPH